MSNELVKKSGVTLLTGASGFVGKALTNHLREMGRPVLPVSRAGVSGSDLVQAPALHAAADWRPLLDNVDSVVHAAARVHVMRDHALDPQKAFHEVNVAGTLALARQAAEAGVRRFVFISSIKVNGEMTRPGAPFTTGDTPAPSDFYGKSKADAEAGLREIATDSGIEIVIVRPPLVYGPGVRANFAFMMRILHMGLPLPFRSISNKRSLVGLDNLVDLIVTCIDHPAAAGGTFLAADGDDMSTPELLYRMADAMGRRVRLFSVPPDMLMFAARVAGRPAIAQRLCESLQVDISAARDLLGWRPPMSVDDCLRKAAQWFMQKN